MDNDLHDILEEMINNVNNFVFKINNTDLKYLDKEKLDKLSISSNYLSRVCNTTIKIIEESEKYV